MSYRIRVVQTRAYLSLDVPTFHEAQIIARDHADKYPDDVAVINDDDDAILCVATRDNHGYSYLALCTTGNTDDPSY